MKFFKKIIQAFIDFRNFFKFRKDIKHEFYIRDSKFNNLGLKRNWLGDVIYVQLNCSDVDLMNAEYNSERMVMLKLRPIIDYLSQELDWGDYLNPQIANFVDEDNNPSLSYGVLFVFTPIMSYRVFVIITAFVIPFILFCVFLGALLTCLV